MRKVKVISNMKVSDFEKEVNDFIKDHNNYIIDMQYQICNMAYSVMIVYVVNPNESTN